jgi:lipopolysaccharide/colanic/teichoic acid biosynthesis glycosyltransferase
MAGPGGRLFYDVFKRLLDIAGGLAGLLVLAALFPPVAFAIRANSPGPILFRQVRLARGGRPFVFYKFRTMRMDRSLTPEERDRINEMGGPHFKSRLDPRITSVGRFLRKYSLDELPQFVNVLRGDMSLVGPRPALRHEVKNYDARQMTRLSVKPGITGVWQVSGRSGIDFYRMVEMDIEYINRRSLFADLAILCRTVTAVLSHKGAW